MTRLLIFTLGAGFEAFGCPPGASAGMEPRRSTPPPRNGRGGGSRHEVRVPPPLRPPRSGPRLDPPAGGPARRGSPRKAALPRRPLLGTRWPGSQPGLTTAPPTAAWPTSRTAPPPRSNRTRARLWACDDAAAVPATGGVLEQASTARSPHRLTAHGARAATALLAVVVWVVSSSFSSPFVRANPVGRTHTARVSCACRRPAHLPLSDPNPSPSWGTGALSSYCRLLGGCSYFGDERCHLRDQRYAPLRRNRPCKRYDPRYISARRRPSTSHPDQGRSAACRTADGSSIGLFD